MGPTKNSQKISRPHCVPCVGTRDTCPNFLKIWNRARLSFFWMQNHNGTWAPKKITKKYHALLAFHVLVPETHVPTFLKCEFEAIYPFFGCIITMEHGPHKQFPKNLTPSSRSMCRYPRHMSQLSLGFWCSNFQTSSDRRIRGLIFNIQNNFKTKTKKYIRYACSNLPSKQKFGNSYSILNQAYSIVPKICDRQNLKLCTLHFF